MDIPLLKGYSTPDLQELGFEICCALTDADCIPRKLKA